MKPPKTTTLLYTSIIAVGFTIFAIDQANRRSELMDRITELEAALARASDPNLTRRAPSRLPSTSRFEDLKADLASERARREKAEDRAQTAQSLADELEGEVVVAFGKVDEIGNRFGSLFKEALAVSEAERLGELDTPENQRRVANFLREAASFSGLSDAVIGFDGNAEDGGAFFASTYQSVFDLDEDTTRRLEAMFQEQISAAGERDLTLANLPIINGLNEEQSVEEQKAAAREWLGSRRDFYRDFRANLREQIPPEKQQLFDHWVEVDGIGFNNVSFRGQTIGFTLGGKQRPL